MKFKAWQPPVVVVDGQLGQGAEPPVVPDIVVPFAGVPQRPNLRAIMYHPR